MGRSRPLGIVLLFAAALLSACAPTERSASTLAISTKGSVPAERVQAIRRDLEVAERRARDLQGRLAEQERESATAQAEVQAARAREQAAVEELQRAQASAAAARERAASAPPAAARPPEPASPPAAARAAGDEEAARKLAEAERQIATLERQLAAETQHRQELETEMARLREETAAGPFERAPAASDTRLRADLDAARREITELKTTLAAERRERAEITRRYVALQAQVQEAAATAGGGARSEEIEALKERQRRVLASIQQDLEASRRREEELRATLATTQGLDAESLADAVAGLRTENSALQLRLNEEHRQNRDLAAKLQLATRVTDLIFKMQTGGTTASAPPAAAAPR